MFVTLAIIILIALALTALIFGSFKLFNYLKFGRVAIEDAVTGAIIIKGRSRKGEVNMTEDLNSNFELYLIAFIVLSFALRLFFALMFNSDANGSFVDMSDTVQNLLRRITSAYNETQWGTNSSNETVLDLVVDPVTKEPIINESSLQYPPLAMFLLTILGGIAEIFKMDVTGQSFQLLTRLPNFFAEMILAYLVYSFAKKSLPQGVALLLASFVLFNPYLIMLSATAYTFNSVYILILFLLFKSIMEKKHILSVVYYTLALLINTQSLFLAPVVFGFLIAAFIRGIQLSVVYANTEVTKSMEGKSKISLFFRSASRENFFVLLFIPLIIFAVAFMYLASVPFTYYNISKLGENFFVFSNIYWNDITLLFRPGTYATTDTVSLFGFFHNLAFTSPFMRFLNIAVMVIAFGGTIALYLFKPNRANVVFIALTLAYLVLFATLSKYIWDYSPLVVLFILSFIAIKDIRIPLLAVAATLILSINLLLVSNAEGYLFKEAAATGYAFKPGFSMLALLCLFMLAVLVYLFYMGFRVIFKRERLMIEQIDGEHVTFGQFFVYVIDSVKKQFEPDGEAKAKKQAAREQREKERQAAKLEAAKNKSIEQQLLEDIESKESHAEVSEETTAENIEVTEVINNTEQAE